MQDQDLAMMIRRVRNTIVDLRERVAAAEPKAQAYEGMMRILDLTASRNYAAEPDILPLLDRELEAVAARIKESQPAVSEPPAPKPEGEFIPPKG